MFEYKKIIRTIQDVAGKYRVFIDIGDGEAIMLKFQVEPILKMIKEETQKVIKIKEQEKELKPAE